MGIVKVVQMYQLVRLSPNRKGRLAHCEPTAFSIEKNHLLYRMRPFVPLLTVGPLSQWCYLINGQWPRDTTTLTRRHCDTDSPTLRHWQAANLAARIAIRAASESASLGAAGPRVAVLVLGAPRTFFQFFKTP